MATTFTKNDVPALARQVLDACQAGKHACVTALSGDLGAGKTTLSQAIARELGVTETVISPTFIIMKAYPLPRAECARGFKTLIHIDAYRLDAASELAKLGWAELCADPGNLILIEWPERVAALIPETALRISLEHKTESEREFSLSR